MQTYIKNRRVSIAWILAAAIIASQAFFIATSLHRLETAMTKKSIYTLTGDCPSGSTGC